MKPVDVLAMLACGALFGFGLAWSGMVTPEVVLAFLRLQDFGLMLVMAGAIAVALLAYQLAPRMMRQPLLGGAFERRQAKPTRNTFIGAAIFGIGWGLCGVCPGPAIAGLGTGNADLLWALLGIFAGAGLQGFSAGGSAAGEG